MNSYALILLKKELEKIEEQKKSGIELDDDQKFFHNLIKREVMILEAIDTSYIKYIGLTDEEFEEQLKGKKLFVMDDETYIQTKRNARFIQDILQIIDNFEK